MITRLHLERFESFDNATLQLGPFTLLVGANASGKSNLRDAFRFLHGIARGYTLAEIIGEKRSEGERVWGSIRGGTRGLAFQESETFLLEVDLLAADGTGLTYAIQVNPGIGGAGPQVVYEDLSASQGNREFSFKVLANHILPFKVLAVSFKQYGSADFDAETRQSLEFLSHQPVLTQCLDRTDVDFRMRDMAQLALDALKDLRFLDLSPDAMRQPAIPGQVVLSDRGENLAAVLQHICADPQQKATLLEWLHELTPMDASDFEFPVDPTGRVTLTLVEQNGQRTSVYNASDGTLRFLALLAALLGPQPAHFYFLEELENGIHPNRLYLLLNLIEQQVAQRNIQIVASTHSPQLLLLVRPETLEHVALTYRLEDMPDTRITKVLDLPEARRLVAAGDIAQLHAFGWLEEAVAFLDQQRAEQQDVIHLLTRSEH